MLQLVYAFDDAKTHIMHLLHNLQICTFGRIVVDSHTRNAYRIRFGEYYLLGTLLSTLIAIGPYLTLLPAAD